MTGKAFLIAVILTPIIRDISRSFNLVDRPGKRKVHAHPLPRVGGIAIAIAYCISLISFSGSSLTISDSIPVWRLLPGAALVFLTGLLDDVFSLKPFVKILGLVAAATVVFFSGIRIGGLAGDTLGMWLQFPLTVLWLVSTSNALNLIDGLDGLCAGMGLMSTLALFMAAIRHGNYPLAYATLPLAGALLGFLCYNINPATVFLGDSGALTIGFLLGCYGMIWSQKTSTLISMMVPMLALSVPLLDAALAVVRRFLRHQPIFSADRRHIHHRLLDRGLSPRQAVWILYLFAALAAGMALLASSFLGTRYQGFIILLFCGLALIGIRQLRYSEFGIVGRFLFRGELNRTVNLKLKMETLEAALDGASSETEWWAALSNGIAALDLISVRWVGLHGARETRKSDRTADWTFRIPVTDGGSVELEGNFAAGGDSAELLTLGDLIRRTLRDKLAHPADARPEEAQAGETPASASPVLP